MFHVSFFIFIFRRHHDRQVQSVLHDVRSRPDPDEQPLMNRFLCRWLKVISGYGHQDKRVAYASLIT
jgi:uncharacterized protein YqiB (DUF1249 family)